MTERLRCEAIIFDFDGTLADSMPFLESIGVLVMMGFHGVPKDEAASRYKVTTGLPYEHQIKLNFPEHEQNEAAIEEFERMKIERIYDQKLFPDAQDVLSEVKRRGFSVFVSSSTFEPTIKEYFRRLGLLDFFEGILGYRPGFEKGADHFKHVAKEYGIPLEDIVFVGDSIKDYERSRDFCQFIALEGMFTEADFREAGHDGYVVSRLNEVPKIIEKK
ncbi:MAG: HAD family hydrolase [Candidatus Hermodarchaeota archaeon]